MVENWEPWAKLLEFILIALMAMNTFGKFWQKREDVGAANAKAIVDIQSWGEKELAAIHVTQDRHEAWIQEFRIINSAARFSRLESSLANFEKTFVRREICDERTSASSKQRNHDHPRS